MSPRLQNLLILQDRQNALAKAESNLERLPRERAALEAQIKADAATLEAHQEAARRIEAERKKLELEVESLEETIGRYKAQQLETRKNEEYQALTHEIETTGGKITALEDRELELMEAYDEALRDIEKEKEQFKAVEARNRDKIASFEQKEAGLKARAAEATAELAAAQGEVQKDDRSLFERLYERKGPEVVVAVRQGICTGCHMKVTSQTEISARSDERLSLCENCGRILYAD
ncbi:MAG: C4-type zinc ribbon domain-containing protein [Verrucomicrobiota bacterium]